MKQLLLTLSIALAACFFSSELLAQGGTGGGDTGGGDAGGGNGATTDPNVQQPATQDGATGSQTTEAQAANAEDIQARVQQSQGAIEFEDNRQQEFVGKRSSNYFHPYSQFNDNALSGLQSSGQTGRAGGGVGRGGGNQNFFLVQRRSIRSRVKAVFSAPTVSNAVRSTTYNRRLARIPGLNTVANAVKLEVEGKFGRLSGTVKTMEQRLLVERMARLEPGVFEVINYVRIQN